MTTKDDIRQIVEEVNIVQEEMHQICIVNANLSKRIASLESRLLNESAEGEVRFHLSVCRKALQAYMEACVDFRTQSGGHRILSNVSDHLEAAEKVLNRKA